MFGLFKKNGVNEKGNNEGRDNYDPDRSNGVLSG